jgi:hypothetical protein
MKIEYGMKRPREQGILLWSFVLIVVLFFQMSMAGAETLPGKTTIEGRVMGIALQDEQIIVNEITIHLGASWQDGEKKWTTLFELLNGGTCIPESLKLKDVVQISGDKEGENDIYAERVVLLSSGPVEVNTNHTSPLNYGGMYLENGVWKNR